VEAEEAAARVRRVVLPLVALRLVVARWDEVLAGMPKHWWSLAWLAAGLVASEVLVRRVRRSPTKLPELVASVCLDVGVALLVLLAAVWWPREGYPGMLAQPDWGIFPILAVASGLRLARLASWVGAAAAVGALAVLVGLDHALVGSLSYGGGEVALAFVMMVAAALLGDAVAQRVRRLVHEGANRAVRAERARQRLGAYVSEEVAALVLDEPGATLGGEERALAVLFSDLRGFTTYSEQLSPDELLSELNAYFEAMVPAIRRHGGVVDKYIGDAIMVVFGVPRATGDEARRAVHTARAMQQALVAHNAQRAEAGLPPLRQGIGVHYGRCVAGNVGTAERLQYTVVGDTVNVASRLEGLTKELGAGVLVSEAAVEQARHEGEELSDLRRRGEVAVRGRDGGLTVYELV
jgi:adenylate cyclase